MKVLLRFCRCRFLMIRSSTGCGYTVRSSLKAFSSAVIFPVPFLCRVGNRNVLYRRSCIWLGLSVLISWPTALVSALCTAVISPCRIPSNTNLLVSFTGNFLSCISSANQIRGVTSSWYRFHSPLATSCSSIFSLTLSVCTQSLMLYLHRSSLAVLCPQVLQSLL